MPNHWRIPPHDLLEHRFNLLPDLPGVKKGSFMLDDRTLVRHSKEAGR